MTDGAASTAPAAVRTVRVACWPERSSAEYLESLYLALAPHGIHVSIDGFPFEDDFLEQRRHEFDVLHLHWAEYLWGAGTAARPARLRGVIGLWRFLRRARRLAIPVVWTVHNVEPHEAGDWVDTLGYSVMGRYSALTVCHDEFTKQATLKRFKIASGAPLIMRMGNNRLSWPAPAGRSGVRAQFRLGPEDRLLVCFGLFRPYKGFDLAIDAMRLLKQGYHLVVAGPAAQPSYAAELQRLAAPLGNVTIREERLTTQDLVNLVAASDCALFPYRKITGSAALLGAFTLGKGVVASDLPYFRETLSHAPEAGVTFRVGDSADLARAVVEFFTVPDGVHAAAANRIATDHDWDEVVRPLAAWLTEHAV